MSTTTSPYFNTTVDLGDGRVVRAFQILMTSTIVIEAWVKIDGPTEHSTITRDDELGWLGRVGTGPLPASVAALPYGSPERIDAVGNVRDEDAMDALSAIEEAFPGIMAHPYAEIRGTGEILFDAAALSGTLLAGMVRSAS